MITTKKQTAKQKIIHYFEGAGLDYYYWDKAFNMHFGYYRKGLNPFDLPTLLNQMNEEALQRLQLEKYVEPLVLDLGCGLGTTSRYMARKQHDAHFSGFTITPWQVEFGNQLTKEEGLSDQVTLYQADYTQLPISDQSAEAAFALESACYAKGAGKEDLVNELYRVLKPGGRFVITDGFRKHSRSLPNWLHKIYRKNLDCWALTELADVHVFVDTLREVGFKNVLVEDISWRVAPSFAHIPLVTLRFWWDIWRKGLLPNLDQERKNNALAPALGMIMGLNQQHFGYYIISGQK